MRCLIPYNKVVCTHDCGCYYVANFDIILEKLHIIKELSYDNYQNDGWFNSGEDNNDVVCTMLR